MIYTVTLNPAIDKTAVISGFRAGTLNRMESLRADVGGKGINVSRCLSALGAESTAVVILAGGAGRKCREYLEGAGIGVLCREVPGETRTNLKIVDPARGENTDINEPGPEVPAEVLAGLCAELCERLQAGDIVVLSGSLPKGTDKGLYAAWCEALSARGARVILDADGEALRLGLAAKPWLIKPNHEELSALCGIKAEEEALLAAGKELQAAGISRVVISRGGAGAIFLAEAGAFCAEPLSVPVKSTVGAGDSMVAALAYAAERGLDAEETVRLSMAMGAASVMLPGTDAPDMDTVRSLSEKVRIKNL
ncbi:MAG: 1-phosphofructokinase [Clostridia bacterium]|nr:1-phosphofructokinase [Clostridia bacterium]